MIPFGHEVQNALDEGLLLLAPLLICGSEPVRNADGKIVGTRDRWKSASVANTHTPGSAMVLPEGGSAADFRYPTLPVFVGGVCLMAWTWAGDEEIQQAIGRGLIEAGLDAVMVADMGRRPHYGGESMLTFRAAETA